MRQNRLILVVKSSKGQHAAFKSAESEQQRARWLMLADIALGNPVRDEAGAHRPGLRSLREHKRLMREVKQAAAKTLQHCKKAA